MDDEDRQPLVAAEFAELADLLAHIPAARWDTPSLCEGWRVREVVAHMTMAARYDQAAFMAELEQDGFDFGKLSNRIAARDGQLPPEQLVADLRSPTMARWTPPGGGYLGALNHVVIHGLDVTVALGEPRRPPDAVLRVALDDLTTGGVHNNFQTTINRTLVATDLDFSYGSGEVVRAPATHLALQLCGRRLP